MTRPTLQTPHAWLVANDPDWATEWLNREPMRYEGGRATSLDSSLRGRAWHDAGGEP